MGFDLHLPVGMLEVYQKRIEKIPEDKRNSWRFHVVRAGDSLDSIASSLHGRASEIAAVNGLDANALIDAGEELVVPVVNIVATQHPLHSTYTTRAGDTLVTVADRFNVSVEDLRRWNHLSSSRIKPHRTLAVAEPVRLAPASHVRAKGAHGKARTHAEASTKTGSSAHGEASAKGRVSATGKASADAKECSERCELHREEIFAERRKEKTVAAKKHGASK